MKDKTLKTLFFIRDLLMTLNLFLGIYLLINKNIIGIIAITTALLLFVMKFKT